MVRCYRYCLVFYVLFQIEHFFKRNVKFPTGLADHPWVFEHDHVALFYLLYWLGPLFAFRLHTLNYTCDVIYELMWGCNIGMFCGAIALYYRSSLLLGCAICVVSVDQVLCWADLFGRFFTGKWPFAVIAYLEDPACPAIKKYTTGHHFFFLPLCLLQLQGACLHWESFFLCVMLTAFISIWARLTSPKYMVRTGHGKKEGGETLEYMNINLSYEFWADVPVPFLHLCDKQHPIVYIFFLITVMNALVLLPFSVMRYFTCSVLHMKEYP